MIKTTLFMENFYILDDERVRQFLAKTRPFLSIPALRTAMYMRQ